VSRHGYSDECDDWALIRWRGAVESAIRGKRGQKLLTDMLAALDAMPEKRLIASELQTPKGEVCALGALGVFRRMAVDDLDPGNHEQLAAAFDVADALIREIEFVNDGMFPWHNITPEERFREVRAWVEHRIKPKTEVRA